MTAAQPKLRDSKDIGMRNCRHHCGSTLGFRVLDLFYRAVAAPGGSLRGRGVGHVLEDFLCGVIVGVELAVLLFVC